MKSELNKYPACIWLASILIGALAFGATTAAGLELPVVAAGIAVLAVIGYAFGWKAMAFVLVGLVMGVYVSLFSRTAIHGLEDVTIQDRQGFLVARADRVISSDSASQKVLCTGRLSSDALSAESVCVLLSVRRGLRDVDFGRGCIFSSTIRFNLPQERAFPGEFSQKDYCRSLGASFVARTETDDCSIIEPASGFLLFFDGASKRICGIIDRMYPAEVAGIVKALATGDKSQISPETGRVFSLSGTAHVLSVSGLHVGIVAFCLFAMLSGVRNRVVKFVIFFVLIFIFVAITGWQPSALRAGFMAVVFLYLRTAERRAVGLNVICFSIAVIILSSPQLVFNAGFQMSALSILGIAAFYGPAGRFVDAIAGGQKSHFQFLRSSIALTASASIAVAPVTAYYFGYYSIVSVAANLIVVPAISLAMIFVYISIPLYLVSSAAAAVYSVPASFLIASSESLNSLAVSLPYSFFRDDFIFAKSIIISILLIYILSSRTRRAAIFRVGAACVAAALVFAQLGEGGEECVVVPRKANVAVLLADGGRHYAIIADRRPDNFGAVDWGELTYLESIDGPLTVAVSGNSGIALTDALRGLRDFAYAEIPADCQRRINEILNETIVKRVKK